MKRNVLYVEYLLNGDRLKYLLGYLENKKIPVYNFLEIDGKNAKITIDYIDRYNFFAICKNMCYNIKSVKYKGLLSLFVVALKNIGVVIGAILFALTIYLSQDYILKVECKGSGSYFANEIISISKDYGVDKYKKFSNIDTLGLKHALLSTNPNISFVTIEKSGNKLIINSVMQKNEPESLGQNVKDVISEVKGVVESVSVLRGTPLVNKGDIIDIGTPLIGAYITGKEDKTYPTYVVGRITILEERTKFYKCLYIDDDTVKTIEPISKFNENDEVVTIKSTVKEGGVEITLIVRHIVVGG